MPKKIYTNYSTVGDLRKAIENISDDYIIGVEGHWGELVEFSCSSICLKETFPIPDGVNTYDFLRNPKEQVKCLVFPTVDIGSEPD